MILWDVFEPDTGLHRGRPCRERHIEKFRPYVHRGNRQGRWSPRTSRRTMAPSVAEVA